MDYGCPNRSTVDMILQCPIIFDFLTEGYFNKLYIIRQDFIFISSKSVSFMIFAIAVFE